MINPCKAVLRMFSCEDSDRRKINNMYIGILLTTILLREAHAKTLQKVWGTFVYCSSCNLVNLSRDCFYCSQYEQQCHVTRTTPVVTVCAAPIKPEITRILDPRETSTFTKTSVPVTPTDTTPVRNTSTNNVAGIPATTLTVGTTAVVRELVPILPGTPLAAPETLVPVSETSVPAGLISPVQSATQIPAPSVLPTTEPTITPPEPGPVLPKKPSKNLPLSGIIPDEAAPAAAAGFGIVLTGVAAMFSSPIAGLIARLVGFFQASLWGMVSGRFANKEKDHRQIALVEHEMLYLGFSQKEFLVLVAGALLVGGLFLFADQKPLEPVMIAIYVTMGGTALVLHEIAHWFYERKFGCRTEIQFWGIGTLIMVLTAWLFGNVFAQPFLTVVQSHTPREKRSVGLIMLSGPVLSVLIALACLALVLLGGLYATAGWIGFVMNLMTGVYELLPVTPCEGKDIFSWNRLLWVVLFIPLFGFYLFATR
jgi:hypothetical protein